MNCLSILERHDWTQWNLISREKKINRDFFTELESVYAITVIQERFCKKCGYTQNKVSTKYF